MLRFYDLEKQKKESSYPRYYWKSVAFALTDDSTRIVYSGEDKGYRIVVFDSIKQKVKLKGIAKDGTEFSKTFDAKTTFSVFEFYYRPHKNTLRKKSVIPGAAQIYKREYAKAGIFITAAVATAATSIYFHSKYEKENDNFLETERAYQVAQNPMEAYVLGNRAESKRDKANKAFRARNYLITGFAAVYVANIIDSFLEPRIGYRTNELEFDPYLDFNKKAVFVNFKITKKF